MLLGSAALPSMVLGQDPFPTEDLLVNVGATKGDQMHPEISCDKLRGKCGVGFSVTTGFGEPINVVYRATKIFGSQLIFSTSIEPEAEPVANDDPSFASIPASGDADPAALLAVKVYEEGSTSTDVELATDDGRELTASHTLGNEDGAQVAVDPGGDRAIMVYKTSDAPGPFSAGLMSEGIGLNFFLTQNAAILISDPAAGDPFGADLSYLSYFFRGGAAAVVVWESTGSVGDDADGFSVQARLLDADGAPVGDQFQVNQTTTGWQWKPQVAPRTDAPGFFVVWEDWDIGGGGAGRIMGRLFDESGVAQGNEFEISLDAVNFSTDPAVDVLANGDFVVTWVRVVPTFNRGDVVARFVPPGGAPLGETLQVNSEEYPSIPEYPDVASYDNEFFIVWQGQGCNNGDCDGYSVQLRGTFGLIFQGGFESGDTTSW